ncbi:hypothetical protein ACWERV_32815 [Streptomyces sp. NPDC004031]
MAVTVTKTAGYAAEITWAQADDPHGRLARSVETTELAYALELLGRGSHDYDEEQALQAVRYATELARLLETAAAIEVVRLRDERGLSWRRIAAEVHDEADRQSTVRRQYDAGRRQLGVTPREARATQQQSGGSVTYGGSIVHGDQVGHSGGTLNGDVVMGDNGR